MSSSRSYTDDDTSQSISTWGFSGVSVDKTFPTHHEIVLPYTEIQVEQEVAPEPARRIQIDPSDVTYINEALEGEDVSSYLTSSESSPRPQTTKLAHPTAHAPFQLPAKRPMQRTRQSSYAIGEEWEQVQVRAKSLSCPPSPLAGKTRGKDDVTSPVIVKQPTYAISEPGGGLDLSTPYPSAIQTKDPFPMHYFFSASSSGAIDHDLYPNPYNKCNHRIHSTLQCPCFLFFFFLCCLPGVHYMQKSDLKFKKGSRGDAQRWGRVSTILYVIGAVVGVVFFSISIFFAAEYVNQIV